MLHDTLENLFQAFDEADENGAMTFLVHKDDVESASTRRKDLARAAIQQFFGDQQLVLLRINTVQSSIDDVLVDFDEHDSDHWRVRVHFGKLMQLPAENPAQELRELKELFEECRRFMESNPERVCSVQFLNERTPQGVVFGAVNLICDHRGESTASIVQEAQARVDALVDASPLIQGQLRQVALSLGKIGRYSWATLSEKQLFGGFEGPHTRHLSQNKPHSNRQP